MNSFEWLFATPTLSTLKTVSGLNTQPVLTWGDAAVGDHSPRAYVWNATDSSADDGLTVIKPTSVSGAGRWNLIGVGSLTSGALLLGSGTGDIDASTVWSENATAHHLIGDKNTAAPPDFLAGGDTFTIQLVGADTKASGVICDTAAVGAIVTGRRANTTLASPSALASGNAILSLTARGYNGSAYTFSKAAINLNAAETWGTSANGTQITFQLTPIGGTSNTFRGAFEADGTFYVGATSSTTSKNTGAGTVHVDNDYYKAGKKVTPGSLIVYQATPADPTGTTDATGKMMGLAGSITPQATTRICLTISGDILNATAIGDGASVQLRYGTGSAPANGDALTGTAVGGKVQYVASTTAGKSPFSLTSIITGLTATTAYWLDVGVAAITGGAAAIENVTIAAFEL